MPSDRDQQLDNVYVWLVNHPARAKEGSTSRRPSPGPSGRPSTRSSTDARTGSYRYSDLETQEKTYIGTRIEIVVRTELGLEREGKLDTVIEGHEVDFKWSARESWMIPREAVGELCLLLCGDEDGGTFSVGLVRCTDERLNPGANQDAKRTLSRAGRSEIRWLVRRRPAPGQLPCGPG